MRNVIYYFTGTGNSFIVARDIAEKIKADLVPISRAIAMESIHIDAESIGSSFRRI